MTLVRCQFFQWEAYTKVRFSVIRHRTKSTSKEKRRTEAESRNKDLRARQSLQKKIAALERKLDTLTGEYDVCVSQLSDPDIYQDKDRFHEIMTRHNQLKETIDQETVAWEEVSEAYEALS